jgi:hypothetical protein
MICVLLAFVSLVLSVYADVAGTTADDVAIRKFIDYTESLGFGGAETRLSEQITTENADFINIFGGWTQGRTVFLSQMKSPQAIAFFKGKTREHTIESVRFLRPDVAIAIVKFYNSRDCTNCCKLPVRGKDDGWCGRARTHETYIG